MPKDLERKPTPKPAPKTPAQRAIEKAVKEAVDAVLDEIGTTKFTCHLCGKLKSKSAFYANSDPRSKTRIAPICKECAEKIVYQIDDRNPKKDKTSPTVESIREVLRYLDKPWLDKLYQASLEEAANTLSGKVKQDVWCSYIKNISMPNYVGMGWKDSDIFVTNPASLFKNTPSRDTDVIEQYQVNRKDCIKKIGYDPFGNYPIEEEKPILYAQLESLLDDETKDDGMKMGAVIQIVKKLNQAEKLNDQVDLFISDTKNAANNMGLINKMADTSKKLMDVANHLAKDNGISVNYNNNKSKGASTLSGKMKKLRELGLREQKINSFDIGTCQGMRQVAEISEAARHMQIGYDENIAQEIKDIKVELVEGLTQERDEAIETARRLLLENRDLKQFLRDKKMVTEDLRIIDD